MIYLFMTFTLMFFGTPQLGLGIYLIYFSDARLVKSKGGFGIKVEKHDVEFYDKSLADFEMGLAKAFKAVGFKP